MADYPSLSIQSARGFIDELFKPALHDFIKDNPLSPRQALAAIILGYHVYDWVFEQIWLEKRNGVRHKAYGMTQAERKRAKAQFRRWLADPNNPDRCAILNTVGDIANGTKHSVSLVVTEVSVWGPQFSRQFGPRWVMINLPNAPAVRVDELLQQLEAFWDWFVMKEGL